MTAYHSLQRGDGAFLANLFTRAIPGTLCDGIAKLTLRSRKPPGRVAVKSPLPCPMTQRHPDAVPGNEPLPRGGGPG